MSTFVENCRKCKEIHSERNTISEFGEDWEWWEGRTTKGHEETSWGNYFDFGDCFMSIYVPKLIKWCH